MNSSILADIMQTGSLSAVSGAKTDDFSDYNGSSFSEILSAASGTGALASTALSAADSTGGIVSDSAVSFSEMVKKLSEEITAADSSVISAAATLLQLQGKAAAAIFGADYSSDKSDYNLTDVFSSLFSLGKEDEANAETDLAEVLDGSLQILGDVSDTITAGLTEDESADSVVSALEEALTRDEEKTDGNALLNAVMTFIGTDYTAAVTPFDSENTEDNKVTAAGLQRLTDLLDTLKTDNETQVVKLFGFSSAEKNNVFSQVMSGAASIKINNASVQVESLSKPNNEKASPQAALTVTESSDVQTEKTAPDNSLAAAVNVPVPKIMRTDIPVSETETVYDNIAKAASEQLSEPITSAASSLADGQVKELTVVLKPESMGEVAVKILSDNGKISVLISAQNPDVGKALAENAAALSESMAKKNPDISSVNVVPPAEAGYEMGLDFTNQGFNRKNDSENQSQHSNRVEAAENQLPPVETEKSLIEKEAALWATA